MLQILEAALYKTAVHYHLANQNEQNILDIAEEVRTNSSAFSYELLHMDTPVLSDKQKLTFISSV